jgi:hypothetical protein
MNQLAQKHRQQVAGVVIALCPILDLPGLDGQESGNVGSNRDSLLFATPTVMVERCLKIKQFLAIGAKRLFQPESHSGGQRRIAV